jgi:NADPH2:quinone reductase
MRAIQIDTWCEPEHLRVSQVPEPVVSQCGVLIRVRAAAVSHSLALLIAGRYQRKPSLPFVPGNTVAGEVVATGAAVTRWCVGDRVLATLEQGGLAEYAWADEDNVYAIPPGLPFAEATTFNASYNSVAAALTWSHLLGVGQDHTLLVTGAAGNVGIAAIQIGRLLGAKVIAAASSPAKRARALDEGADLAIDGRAAALRDALWTACPEGAHRALEPVGGDVFGQVLRCLRPEGRVLPIGFASGQIPSIPANLLMVKNISVCGLYMGYYKIDARRDQADRMQDLFRQLGRWWESGGIRPVVADRFPLEETARAFACVLDRNTIGHVVVEPG